MLYIINVSLSLALLKKSKFTNQIFWRRGSRGCPATSRGRSTAGTWGWAAPQDLATARSPEPQMVFVPGEHSNGHLTQVIAYVNKLQYNCIAKCQNNCTTNVLWCQVHSSHIHSNHTKIIKLQQQINIQVKSHSRINHEKSHRHQTAYNKTATSRGPPLKSYEPNKSNYKHYLQQIN